MKTKMYFVSAVLAGTFAYAAAAQALEGFDSICTLDESCAVERSALVAFETSSEVTYKTLSGNFLCAPQTFGSKATPSEAQCHVMHASSSANDTVNTPEVAARDSAYAGPFAIVTVSSGTALTVSPANATEGVTQQNFAGKPGQVWQFTPLDNGYYAITDPEGELALEVKDWETRDGAKLKKTPWINSWNQHWQLDPVGNGVYSIRSRFSGHVLDVYKANDKHNADVMLWTYWGGENQHWRLIAVTSDALSAVEQ